MNPLNSIDNYTRPEGPVVLVIMDGIGIGAGGGQVTRIGAGMVQKLGHAGEGAVLDACLEIIKRYF